MLNGVKIYSSSPVWRHIFSELGATLVDAVDVLTINFDNIDPGRPVTIQELKTLIVNHADKTHVLQSVFGNKIPQLSNIQQDIIVALLRSDGMTGTELKSVLGYMPDVATHTIDTAIYNLRKVYGHEFIKYENGVYKIGAV